MLLFFLFPGQKEPFPIELSKTDRKADFPDSRIPRMGTAQAVQKSPGFLQISTLGRDNSKIRQGTGVVRTKIKNPRPKFAGPDKISPVHPETRIPIELPQGFVSRQGICIGHLGQERTRHQSGNREGKEESGENKKASLSRHPQCSRKTRVFLIFISAPCTLSGRRKQDKCLFS